MPTIYDNKEKILAKGINEALTTVKRAEKLNKNVKVKPLKDYL